MTHVGHNRVIIARKPGSNFLHSKRSDCSILFRWWRIYSGWWWVYFGWRWVVVGLFWVGVDILWVVVDSGGWWWVVARFMITLFKYVMFQSCFNQIKLNEIDRGSANNIFTF